MFLKNMFLIVFFNNADPMRCNYGFHGKMQSLDDSEGRGRWGRNSLVAENTFVNKRALID